MKVSFLITVFNDGEKLKETIPTLLNQKFDSFEIVIVDDGSKIDTLKYLKELENHNEKIVCFFPGKLGRGRALNYGIEKSKGEFIAINDADDLSDPNRLGLQYQFLIDNPEYGMVGSNFYLLDNITNEKKEVHKPENNSQIRKTLIREQPFQHSSVLIRKNVLKSIGAYNINIKFLFDRDIFIRIAKVSKVHNLQIPLVTIKRHSKQFFYHSFSPYKRRYMHHKYCSEAIIKLGFPKYLLIEPILVFMWEVFSITYKKILNKKIN
jgi:glycosyltransferase involved in cell wall biosynthesis